MSSILEINCANAATTTLGHIKEVTSKIPYNATGLSLSIDELEKELEVLKVLQSSWLRAESDKQPIMEETTQQKGGAQ